MVAPPDPVAVESVAEPAKVPRGIMRTLQTEGLFNDAVAIVVFSTSIRSLDGEGEFSHVFLNFLVGAVLAVAIGYVIGWLASAASRTIRNVAATGAVTIIVPFVAYLVAEEVHASGVIAVVVTALEINRRIDPEAVRDRLMTASFWEVVDLLVTGTAFGLMGLEIRNIVDAEGWRQIAGYLGVAAAVVAVSILVRFAATLLLRFVEIRRRSGPCRDRGGTAWSSPGAACEVWRHSPSPCPCRRGARVTWPNTGDWSSLWRHSCSSSPSSPPVCSFPGSSALSG